MSGPMLRAADTASRVALALWEVESPTPGIVIINVTIDGPKSLVPLHWRAGDWTKPPLDIEVHPVTGEVQALQLVLQDEHVPRGGLLAAADVAVGIPIVEHKAWPEGRYRDVRCEVTLERGGANELIVRLGSGSAVSRSGVPEGIMFGWDEAAALCELLIGPLEARDWEEIDAFSGIPGGAN